MGFAHLIVIRDGQAVDVGYAVRDTCNLKGCGRSINRGLGHLCGRTHGDNETGCGRYFCHDHLSKQPGDQPWLCPNCADALKRQRGDDTTQNGDNQ